MSNALGEVGRTVGKKRDVRRVAVGKRLSHNHLCGIEIELIGCVITNPLSFWSVITDGSIRGFRSGEFVLDVPLGGADLEEALGEFADFKETCPTLNTNHTCSVHVHLDVRDLSHQQLLTLLVVYLAFEKGLFKLSGGRDNNPFCAPLYSIDAFVSGLGSTETPSWILNCAHFGRYAGLNLAALHKYGSVEFRHHGGTLDTDLILKWVDVVGRIKTFAMEVATEEDLMLTASASGYTEFATRIFGPHAKELYYEGAQADLMSGIRLAQDVLFMSKGESNLNYVLEVYEARRIHENRNEFKEDSSGAPILKMLYARGKPARTSAPVAPYPEPPEVFFRDLLRPDTGRAPVVPDDIFPTAAPQLEEF